MLKTYRQLALWKKVFIGLAIGMIVGLAMHYGLSDTVLTKVVEGAEVQVPITGKERAGEIADTWILPWGDGFIRLIQMLIVPLITTTLIAGVTAMGDPQKLGSLGSRTILLYLATTLFAVCLGLAIGTWLQPGKGVNYGAASAADLANVQGKLQEAQSAGSFGQRMLEVIPSNPVQALAKTDVLQIIFFSIFLGVGILLAGEAGNAVKAFFESASEVMMRVTLMVMELAPYGVFALITWVMASKGIGILFNLFWLLTALYVACLLQIIFVYGLLIIKVVLRLPMRPFFRGILDAQGVAFSTASSSATLPITITTAEKHLGLNKSVAGSVLPLGATINMDGTSIYLGLVALFAAQATGMELSWVAYGSVALTATLVSIGAAGIPSAGLLLAATVLGVIDIGPEESLLVIAFIFPFDRLLDMMRTMTNVTGDLAVACAVGKWEGMLDEKIYRASTFKD